MSDNSAPRNGEMSEPNKPYEAAKPKVKWAWWKTAGLIAIGIATIGLFIFSVIKYEGGLSYSPYIKWDNPPAYQGEEALPISTISEGWNSNNNLVIVIMPCNDDALNDSVIATAIAAAKQIRSVDKIYVGVFIMPQDDSSSYPSVRLRLYTEAAQNLPVTLTENITQDLIFDNYLARKYLRQ